MSHPTDKLEKIMAALRDPKTGCPWDIEQDFESIVPHTIEETYEVVDAIHAQDWPNLKEELGDLLFQVIFYSQLASEKGLFNFKEVVDEVSEKLVRRHPHVFGDVDADTAEQVEQNWEQIKQQEKADKNPTSGKASQSILDSIPKSLPALSRARKIQKKCAKYGFDWQTLGPVVEKVREEIDEVLDEAMQVEIDHSALELEIGDLLFATVNLSRHLDTDPEVALAKANRKFVSRFQQVEKTVSAQGKVLSDCSLEQLDEIWEQVKKNQKSVK